MGGGASPNSPNGEYATERFILSLIKKLDSSKTTNRGRGKKKEAKGEDCCRHLIISNLLYHNYK